MINIMFICHGNICRSTMAQSYFTHLVNSEGLEDKFIIDSSATSREEIGNPPHYGTRDILKKNNIKLIKHHAKQITSKEAGEANYLICMDSNNIRNLKRIIKKDDFFKISLLLDYTSLNRDIADPWYSGNFEQTFQDIKMGCQELLKHIKLNENF